MLSAVPGFRGAQSGLLRPTAFQRSSCPGLARASTSSSASSQQDVDGRNESGHDAWGFAGHVRWRSRISLGSIRATHYHGLLAVLRGPPFESALTDAKNPLSASGGLPGTLDSSCFHIQPDQQRGGIGDLFLSLGVCRQSISKLHAVRLVLRHRGIL